MSAIGKTNNNARAFTLIELVLVMTIMVIAIGAVFPSLKGFFHGRNLDNEARQFISLTRYGRSRAIAEGVPFELWINPAQRQYGLQTLSGYSVAPRNPLVYTVDQNVQMDVAPPATTLTHSNYWTQPAGQVGALTKIRFQPDGFISDTSPENIFFRQGPDNRIWIAENSTRSRYEIQTAH